MCLHDASGRFVGFVGCVNNHNRSFIRRSVYIFWSFHVLPFPVHQVSNIFKIMAITRHTILKVLSSSLICWASVGVRRLQVAISPRRSYSPLGQVSWNWIRGLNVAFRLTVPCGVEGTLFESLRNRSADMK
jgi:hypothetical protein